MNINTSDKMCVRASIHMCQPWSEQRKNPPSIVSHSRKTLPTSLATYIHIVVSPYTTAVSSTDGAAARLLPGFLYTSCEQNKTSGKSQHAPSSSSAFLNTCICSLQMLSETPAGSLPISVSNIQYSSLCHNRVQ